MAYIGVSPSNGVRKKHTYTATASQTSFSGAGDEGITLAYRDSNYVDVYQNGVKLADEDYTATSGTAIVLAQGASADDIVEIIAFDVFSVADTVSKADGGTFDGAVTFVANIDATAAGVTTSVNTFVCNGGGTFGGPFNTINGNGILRFRDDAIQLQSSADGQLDIDADTEIEITTTTVDLNGALIISGDTTLEDGADLITATAGTSNFRAGVNAGNSIASGGNYNVVIGDEAGTAISTGDKNVAIGFEALKTEDANGGNTAIGYRALKVQDGGAEVENTAIGSQAGQAIDLGRENVLVGANVGDALDHADYNVAMGNSALGADVKGHKSTAIGYASLNAQSFSSSTDSHNTAVGYLSGVSITTGIHNTLIGSSAGDALSDADTNVAVGSSALTSDTKGSKSVAVGHSALEAQNFTSATTTYNTAIGSDSGKAILTGTSNTLIGGLAGAAITTGASNTCIGRNSGSQITTGASNTILGRYQGNSDGIDIRTGSNNIVLSDGSGNARMHFNSDGDVGIGTPATGVKLTVKQTTGNQVISTFIHDAGSNPYGIFMDFSGAAPDNNTNYFYKCDDSSATRFYVYSDGDVQNHDNSYGAISDIKLKEQITDASSQWNDIKALTVRKYKMKSDVATGDSDAHWRLGVVAQEVETAGMNGLVKDNPDLDKNNNDLGTTTKSVKYSILYMKAVKALQEAITRIETLESKVATLEGE